MKTYSIFFTSKRSPLFIHEVETGRTFKSGRMWPDKFLEEVDPSTISPNRHTTWKFSANTPEEARVIWVVHQRQVQLEKASFHLYLVKKEEEKINELLQLDVIPATPESLRLLLKHLNRQSWGTWVLPKLSIGYSAHQYDCDGVTISTITLDRPIEYNGKKIRKFKSGNKKGHLLKYQYIR